MFPNGRTPILQNLRLASLRGQPDQVAADPGPIVESAPLARRLLAKIKGAIPLLDVGGEGRYSQAINVGPFRNGMYGEPIPNYVEGRGENIPAATDSIRTTVLEAAPIREETAGELVRVTAPGGKIVLVSPSDYAAGTDETPGPHAAVVDEAGGPWYSEMIDTGDVRVTRTVVALPGDGTTDTPQNEALKGLRQPGELGESPRSYSDAIRTLGTEGADLEYRDAEATSMSVKRPDAPDFGL